MTGRPRGRAAGPGETPFSRWIDSVVPAVFPTDAALARAAGVDRGNIRHWRRGSMPQVPALLALSRATGMSIEMLLKIAGYVPPEPGEDAGPDGSAEGEPEG